DRGQDLCAERPLRIPERGGGFADALETPSGILLVERYRYHPRRDAITEPAALLGGADADRRHDAEIEMLRMHAATLEKAADGTGDGGQNDVVQGPAHDILRRLHASEVHCQPVEAAMRADWLVERRRRGAPEARAERVAHRPEPSAHVRAGIACLTCDV